MAIDPKEAERRAAALEALRHATPPRSEAATFWEQHGRKIIGGLLLLFGLWLVARAVGGFMHSSASETEKAQEVIRRGLRR
jgi:fatty acid desaturase